MSAPIQGNKRIRKDDKVVVIAGNNRGQMGKVLSRGENTVVIQGVNMRKKHVKATRESKGGIIEREAPIHISNVKVCDGDKPVKLHARENKDGVRELYYNDGKKAVAYRALKKK